MVHFLVLFLHFWSNTASVSVHFLCVENSNMDTLNFSPFVFHRNRKSNQPFWMNYSLSLLPSESPREFPIAISSKQVREVLRSEVSKSVPVTNQATAIETKCSQVAAVCQRLKEGEINQQPAEEAIQIDPAKPGLLCCFLVTADNNTSGIFHIFQLVIFTLSMCMFFFQPPLSPT